MRQIIVRKADGIKGHISVPGDKSISHRAVILGCLADGITTISNFLEGEDCLRTVTAFSNMGIEIEMPSPASLVIRGNGLHGLSRPDEPIYAGNSGTTMRLLAGVLAAQKFPSTLTGDESLTKRPMKRIIEPLAGMGATISSAKGGYPPLTIKGGTLYPVRYELPLASAQVKSCILLAGLYSDGSTSVIEPSKSRDHTERMLEYMGADIKADGLKVTVRGNAELKAGPIIVPGDISSASFFITAALLTKNSTLKIKGVGINPTRTGFLDVLKRMGAKIAIENKHTVNNEPVGDLCIESSRLRGVKVEGSIIPALIDEIPILAVAACMAEGVTEISDAAELRVKETDRLKAISSELSGMGARIREKKDGLVIEGNARLKGATVNSFKDHRMAMALVVAGLLAEGETVIRDTDCMDTSFPGFEKVMDRIRTR